jgi:hypothetical protein
MDLIPTAQIGLSLTHTDPYNNPFTTCFTQKICPIVSIPALADITAIHRSRVPVHLRW